MTERQFTTPIPAAVLRLGQHGGFEFIQVNAVLAIDEAGRMAYHCTAEEWDESPEAQAIKLDERIEAKRQELEALLRQRGAINALGDIRPLPQLPAPAKPTRRHQRYACLLCGRSISNFAIHGAKVHPEVADPRTLRGEPVEGEGAESPPPSSVTAEAAGSPVDEPGGPEPGGSTPPAVEEASPK